MAFAITSHRTKNNLLLETDECKQNSKVQYLDRIVSPKETVSRTSVFFEQLGITRIADQTGLDRIGIHCYAAFRPNSKSLANNQGKGLDSASARASAVMEAVEFAVAENPNVQKLLGNILRLNDQGHSVVDVRHLLPIGELISESKELHWISGYDLKTKKEVLIPFDAVSINAENNEIPGICKSTNGLASGNCKEEAIFHGLCELIERDASTLWSLNSKKKQAQTIIDPNTWNDDAIDGLFQKVEGAGLEIKLFDQTSDIGMPCVMAVIGEVKKYEYKHFDLAAGYGAHPNAARAAIRAITEAAQTRITSIAGSRDDIIPSEYSQAAASEHVKLLETSIIPNRKMTSGIPLGTSLTELLNNTVTALEKVGINDIFVFPLCGSEFNFSVMKLIIPSLEDREANSNWRPNIRALEVMLAV